MTILLKSRRLKNNLVFKILYLYNTITKCNNSKYLIFLILRTSVLI